MGWTCDSLALGGRVQVSAHPELSGRPYGLLYSIEKEGGIVLPTAFDEGTAEPTVRELEETAVATSLNGIWMARSSELVAYPGGFDGFFTAQLQLTEAGEAARDAYDWFAEENPESQCIVGRPTPAMLVSSNLFPMRYRLNDGGTRMTVEFVLEDPEYIAEPLIHSRELIYAPQIELSRYDCDPETARRFQSR